MSLLSTLTLCLAPLSGVPWQALRANVIAPERVEVGMPFEVTIELRHGGDHQPELEADMVGDGWVVLDEGGVATRRDPEGGDAVTTVRWTLCALEPMETALPVLIASLERGYEAPFVDLSKQRGIDVVGVLAPDEDEPRGLHGFREPRVEPAGLSPWTLGALAAGLLGLIGAALLLRSKRASGARTTEREPAPLERLAAIQPRELSGPDEVQAAYFELTDAVRTGIDRRLGVERSGCTDEEWVSALAEERALSPEDLDLLADLLSSSAEVKYGGSRPTHWAVEEALKRAQAALEASAPSASRQAPAVEVSP